MTEAILFPDVEALVITHLEAALGVPVSTKVRTDRPFVRVVLVGGPRRDLVTSLPMVTVEAWGANSVEASDLGRRAQAHVYTLSQKDGIGAWVRRVTEVGGLNYFPDPETETPRYTFTVQLDVRGEPL